MTTKRQNDHALLIACLRDDMPGIAADMAALGHEILTIETGRHPERAEMLQGKGTSKNGADSTHCFTDEDGKPESYAVDIGNARGVGKPGTKRAGKVDWWSDWVRDPVTGIVVKTTFFADLETVVIARGWFRILSPGVTHDPHDNDSESWDAPHVQVIPVRFQARARRLLPAARRALVMDLRKRFAEGKLTPQR